MMRKILYGMLLFVPIALIGDFVLEMDPVLVFIFAGLGIIPLADFIGEATEELAVHTGPKLGGLLNATLGNAAELIITIFALKEGLMGLVLASITGSIIGNLLLVLGLSLLIGGLKNGVQTFDRRTASMNATLLILAVLALSIPSLFDVAIQEERAAEVGLSEGVALVLIILYGLSVFYSFQQGDAVAAHDEASGDPVMAESAHAHKGWTMQKSIGILALATLGIVFMSEVLVGAVEHVSHELSLSEFFIGIIIVPLVGNVAEHLVAVEVAYKNKMELSLAVSLGSSLQIALFVAPVLVFISLFFDETLLLVFNSFELVALGVASFIAAFVALDGESNWLEGAMLLALYFIIGLAFYYLPAA
jgi:Ca2+:H+ antiporter